MATLVHVSCDCGWAGTYPTQKKADWCLRKHSCDRWRAKTAAAARAAARKAAVDHTPKPCHHKRTRHTHGTHACYVLDRCRCHPCSAANATYEKQRVRQQAYGRWNGLVDAAPAREHIRALQAAGLGLKRVAALSGVPHGSLSKLMYGTRRADGTTRAPSQRIKPATAAAVLAVRATLDDLGATVHVDGTGTRRRLQALVAIGWSVSELGRRLSMDNVHRTIKTERVNAGTARAVRALYDQLWDTPPQPATRWERAAVSRVHADARRAGWAPPLAWDDDTIDDPAATPDLGASTDTRRRVHLDDVEFLIGHGATWHDLPGRLGVTRDAIDQACRRADRRDLLERLSANTSREDAA